MKFYRRSSALVFLYCLLGVHHYVTGQTTLVVTVSSSDNLLSNSADPSNTMSVSRTSMSPDSVSTLSSSSVSSSPDSFSSVTASQPTTSGLSTGLESTSSVSTRLEPTSSVSASQQTTSSVSASQQTSSSVSTSLKPTSSVSASQQTSSSVSTSLEPTSSVSASQQTTSSVSASSLTTSSVSDSQETTSSVFISLEPTGSVSASQQTTSSVSTSPQTTSSVSTSLEPASSISASQQTTSSVFTSLEPTGSVSASQQTTSSVSTSPQTTTSLEPSSSISASQETTSSVSTSLEPTSSVFASQQTTSSVSISLEPTSSVSDSQPTTSSVSTSLEPTSSVSASQQTTSSVSTSPQTTTSLEPSSSVSASQQTSSSVSTSLEPTSSISASQETTSSVFTSLEPTSSVSASQQTTSSVSTSLEPTSSVSDSQPTTSSVSASQETTSSVSTSLELTSSVSDSQQITSSVSASQETTSSVSISPEPTSAASTSYLPLTASSASPSTDTISPSPTPLSSNCSTNVSVCDGAYEVCNSSTGLCDCEIGYEMMNDTCQVINDYKPVIEPDSVYLIRPQQLSIGTVVHTVTAYDNDTINNLTYILNQNGSYSHFSLNATSGSVAVATALPIGNLSISLVASDGVHTSNTQNIVFNVFSVPTPNFPNLATNITIQETTPVNSSVLNITCTAQNTPASDIQISISNGGSFFRTNENMLLLVQSLDGSSLSEYTLTVECANKEYQSSYNITTENYSNITIFVEDVPEEWIMFSESEYEVNITENSPIGFSVLLPLNVVQYTRLANTMNATSLNYSQVNITLTGYENYLYFNKEMWSVTVLKRIDRELQPVLSLLAIAEIPGSVSQSSITVNILDINDNPPVFNSSVFYGRTTSRADITTIVLTVRATDPDAGNNGSVNFFLNNSTLFSIHNTSGEVNPAVAMPPIGHYILTATAADGGIHPLYSTAHIVVTVFEDPTDTATFERSIFYFEIEENATVGSVVGSVGRALPEYVLESPVYAILSQNPPSYFHIDRKTGRISTLRFLDFEGTASVFKLVVQVTAGQHNNTAIVYINITDVNDNAPQFLQSFYTFTFNCSTVNDTTSVEFNVSASDGDHGANGHVTYSLSPDSNFTINRTNGIISPLDCPPEGRYVLIVTASDAGTPVQSTEVQVHLFVSPAIPSQLIITYEEWLNFTIQENSPRGSYVGFIQPLNVPTSLRSLLRFLLLTNNDSGSFIVDMYSGALLAVDSFDRERKDEYVLQVSIVLSDTVNATVEVRVYVADENDNDPMFTQPLYTRTISGPVMENMFLLQVSSTDADLGKSVSYSIVSSSPRILNFFVVDNLGNVRANENLAFGTFSFLVEATNDQNGLTRRNQVTIVINVVMDPDMLVCSRALFTFVIEERPLGGHILGHVTVTAGNGAIVEEEALSFADNSDTFEVRHGGTLYATESLDAEAPPNVYNFIVTVTSQLTSSNLTIAVNCSVMVLIANINDNGPNITNLPQVIDIHENVTGEVYKVNATDSDSNAVLEFHLLNPNEFFDIIPVSGNVLMSEVDRDVGHSVFQLIIAVNDTQHTDTGVLTINILDVNDNAPVLIAPRYYRITERCCANEEVFTIVTKDIDDGQNAMVSLSLGNHEDVFEIRGTRLFLRHELDYESQPNYTVSLIMSDHGSPPQTSTDVITIAVGNLPDTSPIFGNGNTNIEQYIVPIAPNISAGSEITTLTAHDPDLDRVYFEIVGVSGTPEGNFAITDFSIDRVSGIIYKARVGKFTADQNVTLTVKATDDSQFNVSTTTQVVIKIVPRSLTFIHSIHHFDITENTEVSGSTCTDTYLLEILDVSRARNIHFRINSSIPSEVKNKFHLVVDRDEDSDLVVGAKVCLTTTLDYEQHSTLQLIVAAESSTGITSTFVEISVLDLNDNQPMVVPNATRLTVKENNPKGIPIAYVEVSDEDSGDNAKVTLTIAGNAPVFINGFNIILNKSLNFEENNMFMFYVTGRDHGNPQLSVTVDFTLTVENVNDPPVLDSEAYVAFARASVEGENDDGIVILTLDASDEDDQDQLNRISVEPALGLTADEVDMDILIGPTFQATATNSFVRGTIKVFDSDFSSDSAELYLVIFSTKYLFKLEVDTRIGRNVFLQGMDAKNLKEELEAVVTGYRFHYYVAEQLDPNKLLVSGVFYDGFYSPGPVSGRNIPYDYSFLSVNNSAKIINQNSEQLAARLGFRVRVHNTTTTSTSPPTETEPFSIQLIIAVVIVLVVVIAIMFLAIAIIFCSCRRRRPPKSRAREQSNDNWGMRRKPIGQDNIPLQPRLPDADVNKLLHDDELLDQNIQMPWWDPNYVKDEHENTTTLRATVDGDRRKAQVSGTPSEDANSDMGNYLSSYHADTSTTVTTLGSPRPSEYELFVQGKNNFTTPARPTVSNVKWN